MSHLVSKQYATAPLRDRNCSNRSYGTIFSLLAFFVAHKFVLEPKSLHHNAPTQTEEENDDPDEIHMWTLFNIMFGALVDNVGSLGIVRKYLVEREIW